MREILRGERCVLSVGSQPYPAGAWIVFDDRKPLSTCSAAIKVDEGTCYEILGKTVPARFIGRDGREYEGEVTLEHYNPLDRDALRPFGLSRFSEKRRLT